MLTSSNLELLFSFLQLSFTSSNFSMAFPYVAVSDENDILENSLISGFAENCEHGLKVNHIAYLDSCSVNGKNLKKLQGLHSVQVNCFYKSFTNNSKCLILY